MRFLKSCNQILGLLHFVFILAVVIIFLPPLYFYEFSPVKPLHCSLPSSSVFVKDVPIVKFLCDVILVVAVGGWCYFGLDVKLVLWRTLVHRLLSGVNF